MTTAARTAQAPSLPVAILLLLLPFLGVLQYRGIAPAAAICLAATVLSHRLTKGAWPWPRLAGPVLPALGLGGLALVSAAWAIGPAQAALTGLKFAAFVLAGAAAAQAVAEDEAAPRLLPRALCIGLGLLAALALVDMLTGNALRALVRGSRRAGDPPLFFGLKPAVSVIAILLPLVAAERAAAWPLRLALVLLGLAAAFAIPAETAKISAVVGVLAWAAARFAGPWLGTAMGGAVAAGIVLAPLVFSYALPRLPALEHRHVSAVHRVLIWDFAVQRIADRPLLGWGAEAARTVPGGTQGFPPETMARYGLTSPQWQQWATLSAAQRLPLHTHNAALHVWLELGLAGALLAAWLAYALGRAAGRLGPGATGAYAAGVVTAMLSYGIWQEWWLGTVLLVGAVVAARRAPGG